MLNEWSARVCLDDNVIESVCFFFFFHFVLWKFLLVQCSSTFVKKTLFIGGSNIVADTWYSTSEEWKSFDLLIFQRILYQNEMNESFIGKR